MKFASRIFAAWLAALALAWAVPAPAGINHGAASGGSSAAFVSAKVINDATTSTTWPASATGNLVIVDLYSNGSACGPPSSAGGSWTQLLVSTDWGQGGGDFTSIYYRVVNSTDTGSNLSFSGTCSFSGAGIYVYSGVTTAVLQSTATAAPSATLTLTGFTATGSTKGAVVLHIDRTHSVSGVSISGWTGDSVEDLTWTFGAFSAFHNFSYSSGNVTITNGTPASQGFGALIELQ